jgi:hypothetical protein
MKKSEEMGGEERFDSICTVELVYYLVIRARGINSENLKQRNSNSSCLRNEIIFPVQGKRLERRIQSSCSPLVLLAKHLVDETVTDCKTL